MRIRFVLTGVSLALALLGLLAAGHAAPADAPAPNAFGACPVGGYAIIACPVLNDDVIRQAVTLRLSGSVITRWTRVTVSVQDSVVTLSGTVDAQSTRDLGTILARTVRGVAGVQNQLYVAPGEAGDIDIIGATRRAFSRQSFPMNGVTVNSKEGIVEIRGMVESEFIRDQAGLIAAGVPGATAVHNNLVVKSPGDYMF